MLSNVPSEETSRVFCYFFTDKEAHVRNLCTDFGESETPAKRLINLLRQFCRIYSFCKFPQTKKKNPLHYAVLNASANKIRMREHHEMKQYNRTRCDRTWRSVTNVAPRQDDACLSSPFIRIPCSRLGNGKAGLTGPVQTLLYSFKKTCFKQNSLNFYVATIRL